MGARGPLPKNNAAKVRAGNPGRRTLHEGEPLPPPGEVAPPRWLTAGGLEIWQLAAPVASAMRTLTRADILAFARYCNAYARYLELHAFMMARGVHGTTYPLKDKAGRPRYAQELPQAAEWRRLHEILIRLEVQFGLTPAARVRMMVRPVGQQSAPIEDPRSDSLRAFFAGGGPKSAPRAMKV